MHTEITVPRFLKIKEAAQAFPVSAKALRQAIARNELKAYHPNGHTLLVNAQDVVDWIRTSGYKTRITTRGATA